MIAIIDTGGANLSSVTYALSRLNKKWKVTKNPLEIQEADKVILPGVGTAKDSMQKIDEANLASLIRKLTQPVLGICLGQQILFEDSDEGPTPCLGVIPGKVSLIPKSPDLSLPHMGWNRLTIQRQRDQNGLLHQIDEGDWFYFVHSFVAEKNEYTLASTDYGVELTAVVQKDNFFGVQFHPERSAQAGAQILKNFVEMTS